MEKNVAGLIDLSNLKLETEPFSHCVADGMFDKAFYQELAATFPTCPPASGPTGFTIHRGDALFDQTLSAHPAWRELYRFCNSPRFAADMAGLFASEIDQACYVPREAMRFVDHIESRTEKESNHTGSHGLAKNDLFLRFDFMQGRENYGRECHLDHRRRLATMLLYFDAPGPGWFEGGDLVLHDMTGKAVKSVQPAENRAVLFACTERSWHSVAPVRNCNAPRRFVQISISSSQDLWAGPRLPMAKRIGDWLRRRVG